MKYSINGTGNIVAERDIYSLGGFIPKGTVGGKIASESQLSQDGECWLAGGDISGRPDIVIKDNAYIGTFTPGDGSVHTDGITEFSGNTLIPGNISVRSLVADTKNDVFVKDSFIGISMDVLCGSATGTNFPFEPGRYNQDAPKGTLFTSGSMKVAAENFVRNTATLRLGKNTYVYTPVGFSARIYWAYVDPTGQLAYAGESLVVSQALTKLDHPVYRVCMVAFARNPTLTPAELAASGAKILGHISSSPLMDIRPESASGSYVMDNSSFIVKTSNFGFATTQLWYMAGGLYNTSAYTLDNRAENKLYGTFHSVQRLEYDRYLSDSYRTNVNRDKFMSAYDCPLLRVDNSTYDAFAAKGDLVLRRCTVPKAEFQDDVINGNTYEDIDFSFANEDLGYTIAGYTRFVSSHKQGIYRLSGGPSPLGFASHKGNLADTARLYQAEVYIPLDGNIIEQGAYGAGGVGSYYEASKSDSLIRVRTGKPLPTFGLVFPSLPDGYSVRALFYLDDDFIIRSTSTDPTGLDTTYPYVVMLFRKDDDSAINVTDFIALNRTLRIIDHTKAPEITGSAYVGAGCTVRGDIKLIGDPYVNRVFDVNQWERGGVAYSAGKSWDEMRDGSNPHMRMSTKDMCPVNPGDTITLTGPYRLGIVYFNSEKKSISDTGWITGTVTVPTGASYAGFGLSSNPDGKLLEYSDIPLANVKYLRAFKKRRYITNELDRTSQEDILLSVDSWENVTLAKALGVAYEAMKTPFANYVFLKRPVNVPAGATLRTGSGFVRSTAALDALTKGIAVDNSIPANTALIGAGVRFDPEGEILPSDVPASRLVMEFTPSPRIIVPYGSSTLFISGPKIRMYDNAVLSRNLNQEGEIVLRGDAVGGYDFNPGSCMCSNGHSDAIIKLP
ncbi:hypothetical protein SJC11_5 [Bacteroides phage SJC11]|nr:hypothetical protein SJC09_5 [Bacteroides phage SJC09]QIG65037.1 hypothetical protein SJC11_5 [Bacteroides phage SJC11]